MINVHNINQCLSTVTPILQAHMVHCLYWAIKAVILVDDLFCGLFMIVHVFLAFHQFYLWESYS
jgi:hypothetical protein